MPMDDTVLQLDSFDRHARRQALEELAARADRPARRPEVNMHMHTIFSFNGYGYSPSRCVWEAYQYGLEVAGMVDFDVLDGVAEFLSAGRLLGQKVAAGFESRVFVPEYRTREINSPHEPGVYYLAGMGFTGLPEPGTDAEATLAEMADCAHRRNLDMVERVNAHLDPVTVDYENDVVPLTPAGNATERHMLVAYEQRARQVMPDADERARFWAEKLDVPLEAIQAMADDVEALKNTMRSRLMKYGGVGYVLPSEDTFPKLDAVVAMTLECGAVPSACWLDGTSEGEADPVRHFGFMRDKGIPTVTIIPDRNWNVSDDAKQALLVRKLHEAIEAARQLEMPVLVGTEMNKAGQKFVDTFDASALAPFRQDFLDAAHVMWGHTLLKMTAGVGFTGRWADARFADDRSARVAFFRELGACDFPSRDAMRDLAGEGASVEPDTALGIVRG